MSDDELKEITNEAYRLAGKHNALAEEHFDLFRRYFAALILERASAECARVRGGLTNGGAINAVKQCAVAIDALKPTGDGDE